MNSYYFSTHGEYLLQIPIDKILIHLRIIPILVLCKNIILQISWCGKNNKQFTQGIKLKIMFHERMVLLCDKFIWSID